MLFCVKKYCTTNLGGWGFKSLRRGSADNFSPSKVARRRCPQVYLVVLAETGANLLRSRFFLGCRVSLMAIQGNRHVLIIASQPHATEYWQKHVAIAGFKPIVAKTGVCAV